MINSLFKDSHMTLVTSRPQFYSQERSVGKNRENYCHTPAQNSIKINKPAETSFGGFSNANGVSKLHTSKWAKDFFKMANESHAVFGAFFSLSLTCLLRPATIMALPGKKKNKDDKKYASAHSIASGVIAYLISLVVSAPIAKSIKKIISEPQKWIKNQDSYLLKNPKYLETAKTYANMLSETVVAPPRAIITIALIPLILKYIFGLERKSKANQNDQGLPLLENYAAINFRSTNSQNKKAFQNFMGGSK